MLTEIKEREKQSLTSAELNVIDWINENEEKYQICQSMKLQMQVSHRQQLYHEQYESADFLELQK